ncbi:MAG: BrxA family protein [Promethearchaeota archaeon]
MKKYDTQITRALSLIPETKKVFKELEKGLQIEEIKDRVIKENILSKNTDSTRKKIWYALKTRFLENEDVDLNSLKLILNSNLLPTIKDQILYYYFCKYESIVYDLVINPVFNQYKLGYKEIDKYKINDYFNSLAATTHQEINNWTKETRARIIRHTLAILKDFKILKGSKKKEFYDFFIPLEVVLYIFFYLKLKGNPINKIIDHKDFNLFFLEKEDIIEYLYDASKKGYLTFTRSGNIFELKTEINTLEELVNEFKRKI